MFLLAGDVGGTKTLLALARIEKGQPKFLVEKKFSSTAYTDIAPMIEELLGSITGSGTQIKAACFAIAGPVEEQGDRQISHLTNLPWGLDNFDIASRTGFPKVCLINDMSGIAHAAEVLPPEQRSVIQAGRRKTEGPRLIAAPGTGFNSAISCPSADGLRVLAAESGHAAFSPREDRQLALAQFIQAREGHCSREQVIAGPALPSLLEFIGMESGCSAGDELRAAMAHGDASAAIGSAAVTGSDPLAVATLEFYAQLLAGQVADLALSALPTGGIFIGGGVPPKILPFLQTEAFRAALCDRTPMEHLLKAFHVEVLLDERAALKGALEVAWRKAVA